jgi:hypothetical protein
MTLVERLRGLDAETLTVDEMIELRSGARLLAREYESAKYEVPEWLLEKDQLLTRELDARRADTIRKRLKEIDAAELGLESADEKRTRLREERDRLKTALGTPQ